MRGVFEWSYRFKVADRRIYQKLRKPWNMEQNHHILGNDCKASGCGSDESRKLY